MNKLNLVTVAREKEYPAEEFQELVGKRIVKVTNTKHADEGLEFTFDDGTTFQFAYAEGQVTVWFGTYLKIT